MEGHEMKPKNIAYLKSLANGLTPSINIGKGEIDENLIKAINASLTAHELIKIKILSNSELSKNEVGDLLASKTGSTRVSTIGRIVTLYKRNEKEPKIVLPSKE